MKVLLVDHESVARMILHKTLMDSGFDVVVPGPGESALDALLSIDGPCIAIVDPVTSKRDGLSVCREIRCSHTRHSVYLILLTSLDGVDNVVTGLDAGANDYIVKPYDPSELNARIRVAERTLKLQHSLARQAQHDPLTMLPNSTFLTNRLANCAKEARENPESQFTLLFIDIDRFKVINNSLGHAAGDELMRRVAQRLLQTVRTRFIGEVGDDRRRYQELTSDMVARLSGDEFVVLLGRSGTPEDGKLVAERIHKSLEKAFQIDGQEVFLTASIGISTSSGARTDESEILRGADNAMYQAKLLGRARSETNEPTGNADAVNRLRLESDLRRALDHNEFEVHYQPIVDLKNLRVTAFEALMRWRHPEKGMMSPASFIPLAEEIGLILPMGAALLKSACRQIKAWNAEISGGSPAVMCVNISPLQFTAGNLVKQVKEILEETGLDPRLLELEVTENLTMKDTELAGKALKQLSELGVAVSLDDFGTGYSSLSYLLRLPISTLKIDRSFIAGIEESSESASVVQAIITLGHNLGMKVIAEGIETESQLSLLQNMKCDFGQGYFFSAALEPAQATQLLMRDRVPRHARV